MVTMNEVGRKSRRYYIKWLPRGFINEHEIIVVTGQKNAVKLKFMLNLHEEINNSRSTVTSITAREAHRLTKQPVDGDVTLSELAELHTDPDSYEGWDKSQIHAPVRALLKYYEAYDYFERHGWK